VFTENEVKSPLVRCAPRRQFRPRQTICDQSHIPHGRTLRTRICYGSDPPGRSEHEPPGGRFGIWPLVSGSLVCTHFGGLLSILLKFSMTILLTLSTSGPAQAPGSLRPPLQLRWNDLGGYPCRRGDLWSHSGILLTCSGAACFQNMEVRVLSRSCQGKWQSRPAGACQSGRRSKDVTTWRWMGSVKLVVSLLPSAFRLLSMGMRTKKQPMRHHALLPQKFRWHKYGKPKVRVDSRKAGPFIQAIVSLSRMCAVSQIFRFPRRRCR
jgi:hypothetical protein